MKIFDIIYEALGINFVLESFKKDEKGQIDTTISDEKKEYHPNEVKQSGFNFRPQKLEQYIGQEHAKQLVGLALLKIRTLKPIHICISGYKGAGKSSLANVIANELDIPITWHIAGAFSQDALFNFIDKNNNDLKKPHILFLDEGHNLQKELAEFMYPILEDFIIPNGTNQKIKPFIFITATTEKNTLIKKFAPLVDRCGCDIVLEPYKVEDIVKILIQANDRLYMKNISAEAYLKIASNCRYTPRVALSMLDDLIVSENIDLVLSSRRIVMNSLTDIDIRILRHLSEINRPIGEQVLAVISGQSVEDYRLLYEPFLLMENLISRTSRGRISTEKTKKLLQDLK
jgi:Holliday junction DNA helicase RuvB